MIFFVLFAVFLALASASPPMTGAPGGIVNAAHTINDCDYGTYEEKTHAGSPWAADCMKLADNIFGDGTWYIGDNGEFRQLAQYQSCAFSARDEECGENPAFAGVSCQFLKQIIYIGNEDIRGVIHNAVDNTKKLSNPDAAGRVGGTGVFNCQTNLIGKWKGVRWFIDWNPNYPRSLNPTRPESGWAKIRLGAKTRKERKW